MTAEAMDGPAIDAGAHLGEAALAAGLDEVRGSPVDNGKLEMIVRRPGVDRRETLEAGRLTHEEGLEGDSWRHRRGYLLEDGSPDPDAQLTLTNSRYIALIAGGRERWPLAGDQLYVDLDLSDDNLPPGARLRLGEATIEITALPHTGCNKYRERYGMPALRATATSEGKARHLRGLYARVVEAGSVRVGDRLRKVS